MLKIGIAADHAGFLQKETYSAHQGVEHDDMICLGARVIGSELILEITKTFLAAQFEQEERFIRRLNKTIALENQK